MIKKQIKDRFQRRLEILNAVMFEKGVNRTILAKRHGCSKRTIAKDIALLKNVGFNIEYEDKDREYTLLSTKLQVPAVPLDQEHILSLFIGSQFLVLTPLERQAGNAVKSVLSEMSAKEQGFLRNLTNRICIAPVGEFCDPDILLNVYKAVSECQSVRIWYHSFSQNCEFVCTVNPYGIYIKDRSDAYLVGHVYEKPSELGRFKLCRIRKLLFRGLRFTYPADFSVRKEIEKGFWTGDNEYQVLLRFVPAIAQLVREHEPAERITGQPDGSLLVRKTVRNLKELLWEILSYEANVEVLEPEELREMVEKSIEKMQQVYKQGLDLQKSL